MWPKILRLLASLVLSSVSISHAQDLFERAQRAVNVTVAVRDTSGISVRGGISLDTGTPQSTTILRGRADMGGSCGAFDFGASFREQFEAIPDIITVFGERLIANVPMIALCYATPLGCDLIKHWQQWTNVLMQARYASCQSSRTAAMVAGLSLRDAEFARCMQEFQRVGATLNRAWDACHAAPTSLRLPNVGTGREVRLIEDTLRAAGASTTLQTLAPSLVGEVTLRAGETLGFDSRRPQAALQALYEQHRATARERIEAAVTEYQDTGTVQVPTLQHASSPGQALPFVAIEALATLKADSTRYETHLGQLTTAQAVKRLTWDCAELENALAAGADGQADYSEAERKAIEKKLDALRRNLAQFYAKLDAQQKYETPAIDALLSDFTRVQEAAVAQGIRAPAVQVQGQRYRHQTSFGYSK